MMAIFQDVFKENLQEKGENIHDKITYLFQGKLFPDWFGKPELNMAKELAKRAAAQATGLSPKTVTEVFKQKGDLGVAFSILKHKGTQKTLIDVGGNVSVLDVYNLFVQIANASGEDSQQKKIRLLSGLLMKCSPLEAKYIGRFVDGKMRIGTADQTMIDAIARMLAKDEDQQKECKAVMERAYNLYPDLGHVIKSALTEGIDSLRGIKPTVGIPIRSMLAQRLESVDQFIEKHGGPFAAEYKLDGERIQVHKNGDEVILFSRRQENITSQFSDVVEAVKQLVKARRVILDGEVVAIDPETKKLGKFQVLMQRRRKYDLEKKQEEIPTRVYLFDVMLNEDESMLDIPYLERRKVVESCIESEGNAGRIMPVTQKIVNDTAELVDFYNKAIQDGTEGLLTKSIKEDSVYQPGARGWLWIKLKSLTRGKLSDTMDVVIVGANWGQGRRSGVYGTLLVATINESSGNFEVITRVSSGMDDEKAKYFMERLKPIDAFPPNVKSGEKPDVHVVPEVVLEIAGDEISDSSQTTSGLSIRFPRIIRIREDKETAEITTTGEIMAMRLK